MGYCTRCGYDLQSHSIGENCPECGVVVDALAPRPLPNPIVATVALGIVLTLPLIWIAGGRRGNFYALCAASVMTLVLIVIAFCQQRRARSGGHLGSVLLALVAAAIPLLTLCLFVAVFIIGRSSNVAQIASDSGFDYWGLWFDAWPLLLIGNPICFVVGLTALALPPYRRRFVASWALPIACLTAAAAAISIVLMYFPTA